MRRYLLLAFIVFAIVACNFTFYEMDIPVNLPVSETKPTLLVFCDNSDFPCTDFGYLTETMSGTFGEESVSVSYVFADSAWGEQLFENLGLSELPTVIIFSLERGEVYRHSGDVQIDIITSTIASILEE